MIKFLKRTFYVILGLIALGGAWLYVFLNSDKLAKDIAYLECSLHEVGSDTKDKLFLDQFRSAYSKNIVGRLRDDWIKDKVLLNWVADGGKSEDGIETTHRLNVSTNTYSGYSYSDKTKRTFDRDTLLYTWERQDTSYGQVEYWLTRKCVKVPKNIFEKLRKKSAEATKAKQKI